MFEKDERNRELYCESCSEKNAKDYDLIVNHIKENQGATVMEVITATGASLKSVNCFIEDGSISYAEDPTGKIIDIPDVVRSNKGKFHTRRR